MILEQQLNDVFKDVTSPEYKQGRLDCSKGLKPQSEHEYYLLGYAREYEIGEKESAKWRI